MLRGAVVMAIVGLALPSVAHAYGWPVKPFNRMHAIRGTFDDPRFHLAPDLHTVASDRSSGRANMSGSTSWSAT